MEMLLELAIHAVMMCVIHLAFAAILVAVFYTAILAIMLVIQIRRGLMAEN